MKSGRLKVTKALEQIKKDTKMMEDITNFGHNLNASKDKPSEQYNQAPTQPSDNVTDMGLPMLTPPSCQRSQTTSSWKRPRSKLK